MDENLIKALIGVGGVPIIIALVEITKQWIKDTRVYLLCAIGFGLALNVGIYYGFAMTGNLIVPILTGLMAGLSAGGIYSFSSTLREGDIANKNHPGHIS